METPQLRQYLLAGVIGLSVFTGCRTVGGQSGGAGESDVRNAPDIAEHTERFMEFWARQEGAIPCDAADPDCGQEFPLQEVDPQLGLVGQSIDPPADPGIDRIDISTDVTRLLTPAFVDALNKFDCSATSEVIPTPFFSGIQGQDKIILFVSADSLTANFYTSNAVPSLKDKNSLIRHWKLMHYYNQPKVNPPNPAVERGPSGTFVDSEYRQNRWPHRFTKRDKNGAIKTFGDQLESRLLGIWAAAEGQRFHTHAPEFRGANAKQDKPDFETFYRISVDQPDWKRFMYRGAWHVGLALKCGLPVFAHSGGGSVAGFLVRLLAEKQGLRLPDWRPGGKFVLVGLESVLTEGARDLFGILPALGGRVVMENHVVGVRADDFSGSETWQETIVPELSTAGFVPLVTHAAVGSSTSFWNPIEGGHGGIGFYVLRYGRLPNHHFPKP